MRGSGELAGGLGREPAQRAGRGGAGLIWELRGDKLSGSAKADPAPRKSSTRVGASTQGMPEGPTPGRATPIFFNQTLLEEF